MNSIDHSPDGFWYLEPLDEEDQLVMRFNAHYKPEADNYTHELSGIDFPFHDEDPEIAGYIGKGDRMYVFELRDGKLLKIPKDIHYNHLINNQCLVRETVASLRRGLGRTGLEQIVAASDNLPLGVVCERAPGKEVGSHSIETRETIDDTQFASLLSTFQDMQELELETDNAHDHIFYHPEAAFTVIDYTLTEISVDLEEDAPQHLRAGPQTLELKIGGFASMQSLLRGASAGDEVPEFARRFYAVCRSELGITAAQAVLDTWSSDGLILPGRP